VTITDIWTNIGIEHKYHTINTPKWPNSHKLKIQDGGRRHLKIQRNVNNSGLDKYNLQQISCEDAPRPCRDDHLTKSRNRKLIRVTSSKEGLEHMCVDLTDYNRFLNQTWHRIHQTLSTRRNGQIHINWKSTMAAAAIFNFGKMSITFDWIKISCIQLYGKMHHGDAEMTTWPKVETGS